MITIDEAPVLANRPGFCYRGPHHAAYICTGIKPGGCMLPGLALMTKAGLDCIRQDYNLQHWISARFKGVAVA